MVSRRGGIVTLSALWMLCMVVGARGDFIFLGSARAVSMGGAGLAVVDRSGLTTSVNPASLAMLERKVQADYPGFGVRARGIPIGEALDHLFGNPDKNDSVGLARDFGKRDSSFGAHLDWGLRFGPLEARTTGLATVRLLPNPAFRNWAKTAEGNTDLLTGEEQADLFGAAIYALPAVSVAQRVSPDGSPTRVDVGARFKLMRAIYSHYLVRADNLRNNSPAIPAPELNGGTTITRDGLGVDLGLIAYPANRSGFTGALVITNLLDPPFRFDGTDERGAYKRYDLQPRSFSLGTAWQQRDSVVIALDLIDLTRAYGAAQVRLGAEYQTTRKIALRTGYNSAKGFTLGVGYGAFNFAYGNRVPLEVTHTLRF
jgi:hypothetical protein